MEATNEKNLKPGFSYHIFLFPFQWDFKKEGKSFENLNFLERTRLEDVDALLDKSCWEQEYFAIDTPIKFNEYIYFYDFVRGALYNSREKPTDILHQYNYLLSENPRYIIYVKKNKDPYDLKIERIQLNLYTTLLEFSPFIFPTNPIPNSIRSWRLTNSAGAFILNSWQREYLQKLQKRVSWLINCKSVSMKTGNSMMIFPISTILNG